MRIECFHRSLCVVLALCLGGITTARAELRYGPLSFSAFGTLGGAWLSNRHVDFQQGTQPVGPGRSHDFDVGLDSRLGAQLNLAVTPSTLITAQAVAERLADDTFEPRLTQANLRQEIGDDWVLRIGRIQSPTFLASDYRLANFSNPWVRTPGVLYNIYPLTHLDSAEFTYRHETDIGTLGFNAGSGWLTYPFPSGRGHETTNLDLDEVVYANLKLENGPWHFKLSWLRALLSAHLAELERINVQLAAFDPVAARELSLHRQNGAVYSAGFSYDGTNWLVMAEWGITRTDDPSLLIDKHGGYLTVAYHLERWLPQITLGYQATTDRRIESTVPLVDAILAGIHDAQRTDYRSLALGLGYTLADFAVVRTQVDLIDPLKDSRGPYFRADSAYHYDDPGVDVLFSVTLDFVY